jgi:aldehyde dehydrogenase (NAD+)
MGAAVQITSSVERFVKTPARRMLIDGKWVDAASGKTFETWNPATGEVLARVAEGDAEDVDRAAAAPRLRERPWPKMASPTGEALLASPI